MFDKIVLHLIGLRIGLLTKTLSADASSSKKDTKMADADGYEDEAGDEMFPGQQISSKTSSRGSIPNTSANGKTPIHVESGYSWTREEDAPGYKWKNKKATEEAARAWDSLVGKEQRSQRASLACWSLLRNLAYKITDINQTFLL